MKRELTEREIQNLVCTLYRHCGCKVYQTSQYRISRQALGLPDLYVVHQHGGDWWHETKRPGGTQSKAQKDFQRAVEAVGMNYIMGGLIEAQAYLEFTGIIANQRQVSTRKRT